MNTPTSSAHIGDAEMDRFVRRALSGVEILRLTDHLTACAECRARLSDRFDAGVALESFGDLGTLSTGHVPEPDVHAFVDERLDHARRAEVVRHIDACESCRDEVQDLRASVTRSYPAPKAYPAWWRYGGLAAAATLVLALVLPGLMREDLGRPAGDSDGVTRPAEAAETERRASDPRPLDGLAPADAGRVSRALSSGTLSFPAHVQHLVGTSGALRGDDSAPAFALISPVTTAIVEERPTLRWTAAAPSATYVVTLQDEATGATVDSPPLRTTEWTPDLPLSRGGTYLWQVAAAFGGAQVITPAPPAPPAKLYVLTADDAARAAQRPGSALSRGTLYAELGLLDDAERELAAVEGSSPNAAVAQRFLQQIRTLRGRGGSAPGR